MRPRARPARGSVHRAVEAIVWQQLSGKAAATIYRPRLRPAAGAPLTPAALLARPRNASAPRDSATPRWRMSADLATRCATAGPPRSARRTWTTSRHRGADGGQGHRPLDGGDVPDVPPASARRASRRRSRDRERDHTRLSAAEDADAERMRGSPRRGGPIGRWRAGTCGAVSRPWRPASKRRCGRGANSFRGVLGAYPARRRRLALAVATRPSCSPAAVAYGR